MRVRHLPIQHGQPSSGVMIIGLPATGCENGSMADTGSDSTRLVILRGDAASGKTTTATALRPKLGERVALISQDHFRRELLHDPDRLRRSRDASVLIVGAARQALDLGYDVILDGSSTCATTPTSSRACIATTAGRRASTSSTSVSTRRSGATRGGRSRTTSVRTGSANGTTGGNHSPGSMSGGSDRRRLPKNS